MRTSRKTRRRIAFARGRLVWIVLRELPNGGKIIVVRPLFNLRQGGKQQ